jgi:mannose-6-phosphate isomerase-like protein (cupin superfamily)
MVVKIDGASSRGAYSLIEYSHAAGAPGPPAHIHHHHEEAFLVLEGHLTLALDDETILVGPGQTFIVPRGRVHQPQNPSSEPVRFVFISSPPMDEFFDAISQLVVEHDGRPPALALKELGDRYDSTFVDLPAGVTANLHNEA